LWIVTLKARLSLAVTLVAALAAAAIGSASAQNAGFTDEGSADAFAPLSLIPNTLPSSAPVRRSDAFQKVLPAEEPAVAVAPEPAPQKKKKLNSPAVAEPVAVAEAELTENVPMPPRRPFDLRIRGKKDKVLLAKLIAPENPEEGTLTRSLTALQKTPQAKLAVQDTETDEKPLKRLASLPGVRSDVTPEPAVIEDKSYLVPGGGSFGGIVKQTPSVVMSCFRPNLLSLLRRAGKHFGSTVVVTSGARAGGRRGSYHRRCMAADIKITGVSKHKVAAFFRNLPDAGGVGLYCHNDVVHIDTAEPRNWTYCGWRRTSFSLRGGGSRNKAPIDDGDE
jgi:hypothetical protein